MKEVCVITGGSGMGFEAATDIICDGEVVASREK